MTNAEETTVDVVDVGQGSARAKAGAVTHRERVLKTLRRQETDRAPLMSWLGLTPWAETKQRWMKESGVSDEARLDALLGLEAPFTSTRRYVECGPFPRFEETIVSEDPEFVVSTDWRGITMRNRRDGHSMPEWVEHPIKTCADWDRYKAERLQPRIDERLTKLGDFLDAACRTDAPTQVGSPPWGVFGTVRDLMGAERALMAFYDEPAMLRDIMETHVSLWLALYERIADRVTVDHLHLWEDMSGKQGSLISPSMIEDFMMPQYDRLADFARRRGVPVFSVDSDGRVDELVPVMMRHGVNAFMPFEVQAGCDIEVFREEYPALGIFGGLDKNALAAGRKEMHRELDRAERMLARGGWIPGFDHLIPPNVPWTNYKYFLENLRRLIGI
jgi:uroporphyrinogen decarboxylase